MQRKYTINDFQRNDSMDSNLSTKELDEIVRENRIQQIIDKHKKYINSDQNMPSTSSSSRNVDDNHIELPPIQESNVETTSNIFGFIGGNVMNMLATFGLGSLILSVSDYFPYFADFLTNPYVSTIIGSVPTLLRYVIRPGMRRNESDEEDININELTPDDDSRITPSMSRNIIIRFARAGYKFYKAYKDSDF